MHPHQPMPTRSQCPKVGGIQYNCQLASMRKQERVSPAVGLAATGAQKQSRRVGQVLDGFGWGDKVPYMNNIGILVGATLSKSEMPRLPAIVAWIPETCR